MFNFLLVFIFRSIINITFSFTNNHSPHQQFVSLVLLKKIRIMLEIQTFLQKKKKKLQTTEVLSSYYINKKVMLMVDLN